MENQEAHEPCPTQQQILDYLQQRLNAQQQHEVEAHLLDCTFCREAMEGLKILEQKADVPILVRQVHQQLRRELDSHRQRSRHRKYYVWISTLVVAVLLLLLVAFWAMHYSLLKDHPRQQAPAPRTTLSSPRASAGQIRPGWV